ncbi:MAG: TetR/AcrR family transcriptional regulator [Rikenellaceae bacterium]|nr:TetR/AcrR family transcriptional regulator [Rikenellaceae bacterium]
MCAKETNSEKLILEAAEAVFLEKGYGKARTTEIAKRAGVNHAMLHYYFRTKENLFDTVFNNKVTSMSEIFLFTFNQDLPFLEKIKNGIEDHFDFIASNEKLPNFIFSEIFSNENLRSVLANNIKEKAGKVLGSLREEIDAEIKKGKIRYINPLDLIISIISLNCFAVISAPALSEIMNFDKQIFLDHRKQINVEIILNQLRV